MKRILRNTQLLQSAEQLRYYHFDRAGKSTMGSPYECPPPKSYWKAGNIFDAYPDQFGGFKVHAINPYQMQAIAMYDNWEYQYHGQWWDMGSLGWTIFAAFFPFIFFSFMYLQNLNCKYLKDCEMKKFNDHGGISPYQLELDYNRAVI